jgi:hypothetical protein
VAGTTEWVDECTANVYVTSGEAVIFRSGERPVLLDESGGFDARLTLDLEPRPRSTDSNRDIRQDRARTGALATVAPGLPEDRERASRRARGRVRRWCVSNGATYLLTLTYKGEGQHDWSRCMADVWLFRKHLRQWFPGFRLAVLTVPEWHPGGHGLHVHVATAEYVPKELLERCWSRDGSSLGFVDNGERRRRRGGPQSPRRTAGYLAKYITKAHEGSERPQGSHAYEVTQGSQPRVYRVSGLGYGTVEAAVWALLGAEGGYTWYSEGVEGWRGPPTAFLSLDDGPSVSGG